MLVNFQFYKTEYEGTEIAEENFDTLSRQAEKDVYAFIGYSTDDLSKLDENALKYAKKAICAQAEYLHIHGRLNRLSDTSGGFSIGSFSKSDSQNASKPSGYHPDLKGLLFPTGLLYRGVGIW